MTKATVIFYSRWNLWLFYTQCFDCMWDFFPLFFFFLIKLHFGKSWSFHWVCCSERKGVLGGILPVLNECMRRSCSPLLRLSHLQLLWSVHHEHRPVQKICRWGDSGNVYWLQYTTINWTFPFYNSLTALIKRKPGWVSRGRNEAELWRTHAQPHLETAEMLEDHGNYWGLQARMLAMQRFNAENKYVRVMDQYKEKIRIEIMHMGKSIRNDS